MLARGVVDHLAGHGVELELGLEPLDDDRVQGQKIEEQRPVGRGGQRDEFAFVDVVDLTVDVGQVRRLTAQRWAVVDELELHFFVCVIDNGHSDLLSSHNSPLTTQTGNFLADALATS